MALHLKSALFLLIISIFSQASAFANGSSLTAGELAILRGLSVINTHVKNVINSQGPGKEQTISEELAKVFVIKKQFHSLAEEIASLRSYFKKDTKTPTGTENTQVITLDASNLTLHLLKDMEMFLYAVSHDGLPKNILDNRDGLPSKNSLLRFRDLKDCVDQKVMSNEKKIEELMTEKKPASAGLYAFFNQATSKLRPSFLLTKNTDTLYEKIVRTPNTILQYDRTYLRVLKSLAESAKAFQSVDWHAVVHHLHNNGHIVLSVSKKEFHVEEFFKSLHTSKENLSVALRASQVASLQYFKNKPNEKNFSREMKEQIVAISPCYQAMIAERNKAAKLAEGPSEESEEPLFFPEED